MCSVYIISLLDAMVMKGFGSKDGAAFISEVKCTGSEDKLTLCPHKETGDHECSNAGVTCRNSGMDGLQNTGVDGGTLAGAVIGVLAILVLVAIAVVVLLVIIYRKLRRKKQLERMHLDILSL